MSDTPSKILLGLEPIRGLTEYGLSLFLTFPLKSIVPPGDGHPVLVLPGLATNDNSTYHLRAFLDDIGYKAQPWELGRNFGPRNGLDDMLRRISDRIDCILKETNSTEISIIGWSLGGVYAREIAKLKPECVRQVITLGTPFKPANSGTNAAALYEMLSGDKSYKDPDIISKISQPPPVPFTSIYSKTDGVVHWKCSIEDESVMAENVEIHCSSHLGMGHNPLALYIIADRLIKTKQSWTMFTQV